MNPQILIDRAQIQDLIALYCRAIDRRDEAILRSLYHEDAIEDRGEGIFHGRAHDWISQTMPVLPVFEITQHAITNCLIDIEGDSATGETYFHAYHRFGEPPETTADEKLEIEWPAAGTEMILAGRYLDRFERRDGGWKIAYRKMVCDWCRTQPVLDDWFKQNPLIHFGRPHISDSQI